MSAPGHRRSSARVSCGLAAAAPLCCGRGHRVRIAEQASCAERSRRWHPDECQRDEGARSPRVCAPPRSRTPVRPKAFEFQRFNDGELLHDCRSASRTSSATVRPTFSCTATICTMRCARRCKRSMRRHWCSTRVAIALRERPSAVTPCRSNAAIPGAPTSWSAPTASSRSVRRHTVGLDDHGVHRSGGVALHGADRARRALCLRTDLVSTVWCGPRNHAVTYYLRGGPVAAISSAGVEREARRGVLDHARRPWHGSSTTTTPAGTRWCAR